MLTLSRYMLVWRDKSDCTTGTLNNTVVAEQEGTKQHIPEPVPSTPILMKQFSEIYLNVIWPQTDI
jgi:hypothetical protein